MNEINFLFLQLKKAARLYNQDIKELEKYGEDLREHYEKSKVVYKKVSQWISIAYLNNFDLVRRNKKSMN